MHPVRVTLVGVLVAVAVSACGADEVTDRTGGATGQATVPPSAEAPGAQTGGAAGGTAPRAYPLEEALDQDVDGSLLVTGLLIDDGSGWRLCSEIAESYPPQCGGTSVPVEGVVASRHPLQQAEGVRWAESATIVGEFRDGTLVVTGDAAST